MVILSFAYKEMKDVFLEVLNVKSLNEKAHCNPFVFCNCCLNVARLKVLIFRECGRKKGCLCSSFNRNVFSWHGELRVGNSSKHLFGYENQMFSQFPKGLVCVRAVSCRS